MSWLIRARGHLLSILVVVVLTSAARGGEFPDNWYFGNAVNARGLRALEGKRAPSLTARQWYGDRQQLGDLKGKVVVVDFWATWCGPCMRSIPKNIELVKKYGDDGLVFIGVHDSKRGFERIARVRDQMKINYPIAVDDGRSARAWQVRFWPTYAVVDQAGVLRAIGLKPQSVELVVKRLLAEADPQAAIEPDAGVEKTSTAAGVLSDGDGSSNAGSTVPAAWLEQSRAGDRRRLARLETMDTPPPIESLTWLNGDPIALESLRGKVVMLDFWATWCRPCIASVPKINQLHQKYKDDGLVIIGVCHPRGVERMSDVVAKSNIQYLVCADASGELVRNYAVNGFPDYYFIDRDGKLRIADCSNPHIESAIKMLLAE